MSDCRGFRELTLLSATGDLRQADVPPVREHLTRCESCRSAEENVRRMIGEAGRAYSARYQFDDATRRAIAVESARRVEKGWGIGLLLQSTWLRPGLLAAVAGALVALIALPVALRDRVAPGGHDRPLQIEVMADVSSVRLAWHNGGKGAYTVYKSEDPRAFSRSEAHVVRGNVWVDQSPGSSNIVFYKIE